MELHLDLRESATRASILNQVLARLDGEASAAVHAFAAAAGLPARHQCDIDEVSETIDDLAVSDRVKADMRGVYGILARAEAEVHGCPVERTHFHEVGRPEGLRNVTLICLALEALDPTRITATAVQVGSGQVVCEHGTLDVPAPATAAILAQGIPVCEERLDGELCTPTSAAILKHFVQEFVV